MVRVTVLRVMLCILVVSSAITSCAGSGGRKQVGKVKCGGDRKQVGKIKCGGGRKQVGKVKCGGKLCSIPNASPTCARGKCVLKTCDQGYANCDGLSGNGCEVNLNTDALNCGGCNTACSIPNAVATCATGTCVIQSCNSGYANCDGLPGNGCEVDWNTDALNCGGCNTECSIPNAVATCAAGTCVIQSCNSGYHMCGDECVADNVIGEGGACCDTQQCVDDTSVVCVTTQFGRQHCSGGINLVCEGEGDKKCTCPSGSSWCARYGRCVENYSIPSLQYTAYGPACCDDINCGPIGYDAYCGFFRGVNYGCLYGP